MVYLPNTSSSSDYSVEGSPTAHRQSVDSISALTDGDVSEDNGSKVEVTVFCEDGGVAPLKSAAVASSSFTSSRWRGGASNLSSDYDDLIIVDGIISHNLGKPDKRLERVENFSSQNRHLKSNCHPLKVDCSKSATIGDSISSPVEDGNLYQPFTVSEVAADGLSDDDSQDEQALVPTTVDSDTENPGAHILEPDQNVFWQYKKIPKGPRPQLGFEVDVTHAENPHKTIVYNDPVYDKSQPVFVRHSGKARLGEGNDVTADPGKLARLGRDIDAVNKKMATFDDDIRSKRKKSRLSSRLCRLKRVANHEANKIKLAGLQREREELNSVITKVRHRTALADGAGRSSTHMTGYIESLKEEQLQTRAAGKLSDYVSGVLSSHQECSIFSDGDD